MVQLCAISAPVLSADRAVLVKTEKTIATENKVADFMM
jgi:hypothetical protein